VREREEEGPIPLFNDVPWNAEWRSNFEDGELSRIFGRR